MPLIGPEQQMGEAQPWAHGPWSTKPFIFLLRANPVCKRWELNRETLNLIAIISLIPTGLSSNKYNSSSLYFLLWIISIFIDFDVVQKLKLHGSRPSQKSSNGAEPQTPKTILGNVLFLQFRFFFFFPLIFSAIFFFQVSAKRDPMQSLMLLSAIFLFQPILIRGDSLKPFWCFFPGENLFFLFFLFIP